MPELANVQDDDSTADFDSESAFDLDDDDKSVDLAFAGNAKVTFIDDNHNFVSMYDESESTMNLNGDEDGDISIVAANDILNTRFTTSNSDMEGNDFNDDGEDSKPPALSPSLLKPKTIVSTPITNVQVLSWLEKQHPSLADSFIADFNISSNKPT